MTIRFSMNPWVMPVTVALAVVVVIGCSKDSATVADNTITPIDSTASVLPPPPEVGGIPDAPALENTESETTQGHASEATQGGTPGLMGTNASSPIGARDTEGAPDLNAVPDSQDGVAGMGAPALVADKGDITDTGGEVGDAVPFGGADYITWSTTEYTVEAGEEKYVCFTAPVGEDLTVSGYQIHGQSVLHHMLLSRVTLSPDEDGLRDCGDSIFQINWEPMFMAGAGESELVFPEDAGHILPAGTQLTAQMHVLNASGAPVTTSVTINMRRSMVDNPRPVANLIFGQGNMNLPAGQASEVVGTCMLPPFPFFSEVQIIAGLPHMHQLGTRLKLEAGPSEAELQEIFVRDPYDFNDQRSSPMDLTLGPGNVARVTCTFDNTTEKMVTWGESSADEMCFFMGFAVGLPAQMACIEGLEGVIDGLDLGF